MFGFDARTRALLAEVARQGNVSAAARAVGMDASNARRHLRVAEARAGSTLVRARRGGSDGMNAALTSAGRARLVAGTLRGVALAYDPRGGVTPVRVGRRVVYVAGPHPAGPVALQVPPESVALRRPGPRAHGSQRNEIPVRVEGVREQAEGTFLVRLAAGELALDSLVTRGALAELRIRRGSRLVAVVKAVAVRLTPQGA